MIWVWRVTRLPNREQRKGDAMKAPGAHPVVWLLCVMLVGGCARSLSPYERAERDRRILDADIRRAVEMEIAEANERAAKTNDVTWVDVKSFDRVVFFVPKPKPRPPADSGEIEPPVIPDAPIRSRVRGFFPPIGAPRRQWTDRYALAQRYAYHYAIDKVTEIRPEADLDHPYAATVTVRMTVEHARAIAADAKPVPQPPQGMMRWKPTPASIGIATGFFGGVRAPVLPDVVVPGRPSAEATGPLAAEAVSLLRRAEHQRRTVILKLTAKYSLRSKQWSLTMLARSQSWSPAALGWDYGVPKGEGLLDPSHERTTS